MKENPKILRVETGLVSSSNPDNGIVDNLLDYRIYIHVPQWWRRIEELLRMDIYLAFRAKLVESHYDLIWIGSEKAGIPLSFMRVDKPLIVIAHHMESPMKARFAHATGVVNKWAGIGYVSNESKEFFINNLDVPINRLFQYESAKYLHSAVTTEVFFDGPIMSIGTAKRDYNTLISALADLREYETELFVSSKFGDKLSGKIEMMIPEWVHLMEFVPEGELLRRYQHTRFVVVPLEKTTHNGAGINIVLEAGAFSKAVIATRTGGMSSFVIDGKTGILVPPNDTHALRNAIQKLWNEPDLAYQMGMANRDHIESNFNPEVINLEISTFLDKIYADSQK